MQDEKVFIAELLHPKTQNEAFRKLLQLYQKPLYHHIRGIVLNHDDTDDVLQNTFIKVHSNLHKFKLYEHKIANLSSVGCLLVSLIPLGCDIRQFVH